MFHEETCSITAKLHKVTPEALRPIVGTYMVLASLLQLERDVTF